MVGEKKPTRESVEKILAEYDRIGDGPFLNKYEKGYAPDRWLLRVNGKLYPMKAIWVAAHMPNADPSRKDYRQGILHLRKLGFFDIVPKDDPKRSPIELPTRESVEAAMGEYREIGTKAFLDKYTEGYQPKSRYIREGGIDYPLKALYGAAHQPTANHRHYGYKNAEEDMRALGFEVVINRGKVPELEGSPDVYPSVQEGKRIIKEIGIIQRSKAIVKLAKDSRKPLVCEVCNFDFEKTYGTHGKGFIEAHHVDPLSKREGVNAPTGVADFAMLCANCHRMAHYGPRCLSVVELRALIKANGT
ncbi:HNH endonuclease [Rhizobium sp. NPDC090275]|uniref:HNH endonuclease n=1 Tax=Rhizobium sp. NPDC090275 TaxID=3364498 RepID=UPI00383A132F